MALLDIDHAKVHYDRFNLDVSLKVEEGTITGLIGRNGSGKTTLLKSIMDVIRAGGKVEIFGKKNTLLTEKERADIGITYTDIFFNSEFKVTAVKDILRASYPNFNDKEYDRLTDKFGIPVYSRIKNLSTGELAKLRFISAITHEARLLILDEPTSGLDVVARGGLLDELRNYMEAHEGSSILISSNISKDLEGFCDDVYIIDSGSIILHENTDEITDEFGLIKCSEGQFAQIEKEHIRGSLKTSYGMDVLVSQKKYYRENFPELTVEDANLDTCLIILTTREGKV